MFVLAACSSFKTLALTALDERAIIHALAGATLAITAQNVTQNMEMGAKIPAPRVKNAVEKNGAVSVTEGMKNHNSSENAPLLQH
jgi:hypothetical protein